MSIIVDGNLELQPWSLNIPSNGSDIGGVDPAAYSLDQSFDEVEQYLEGTTQQGGYPTIEAYIKRSILTNTGNVSLSFDLLPNLNLLNEYLYETDLILAYSGFKYNMSLQVVWGAKGGDLQIANEGGGWVSTGLVVPFFSPNVSVHYLITYQFNVTTKKYSTLAAVINNQLFQISANLQNLTAQVSNWAETAVIQQQRTLTVTAGSAGKSASDRLKNIQLTWW
jgi:hypothetical protein